jgi:outer membrane protein TolC
MRREKAISVFIALGVSAAPLGCGKDTAWTAAGDRTYRDDIQHVVERRIEALSDGEGGAARWRRHQAGDYQDANASGRMRRHAAELSRHRAAQRALGGGPLSLEACLIHALLYNDDIQAALAEVRSTGGEKLIVQSRYLPRLTYDLSAENLVGSAGRNLAMGLRALQTVLEFGKDNPLDVSLRASQREALFAYEDTVASALSTVRLKFYTILLRQKQLAARRLLREEFQKRYDRIRRLAEARRVPELDVLTAKLNVLNERAQINALDRETRRQKIELLQAMGFPLSRTAFELTGRQERFRLPMARAVKIAFARSTQIAQARADVFEQDRVVRQIVWEYLPSIELHGGFREERLVVGGALASDDRLYAANGFAEDLIAKVADKTFMTDASWLGPGGGWFLDLTVELPLLSGLERTGRYRMEKALLVRDWHRLLAEVYETELDVRQAYQTVLERERDTEIFGEKVRISRERLRVNERLKELNKIGDDALETFRNQFFSDQDAYFQKQIDLVAAQEDLRRTMRYFSPLRREAEP